MSNYAVGCNVYLNINTTRYKFYSYILDFAQTRKSISYDGILKLGKLSGMSAKLIEDEIIGCLYANFLISTSESYQMYQITPRAIRDFSTYQSETMFKTNELTFTIDFRKKDIKTSFFTTDTISIKEVELLKPFGWTYNKSLSRCMHKCNALNTVSNSIETVLTNFDSQLHEYSGTFDKLIKEYGYYRRNFNDYSVNLNHKGLFKCNTGLEYSKIYEELKKIVKNPIDWGGESFDRNLVQVLCNTYSIDSYKFLSEAINDGMIRKVNNKRFSITGHAATIINSITSHDNKNRISIIIRKLRSKYSFLIGCNTLYENDFIQYLITKDFTIEDDWYYTKFTFDKEELMQLIDNVIDVFNKLNREVGSNETTI